MTVATGVAEKPTMDSVLWALWREHSLVLTIVFVYLMIGYVVQAFFFPGMMRGHWYAPTYIAFFGGGILSFPIVLVHRRWQMRGPDGQRINGDEGWRLAWRSAREDLFTVPRLARLAITLALVPLISWCVHPVQDRHAEGASLRVGCPPESPRSGPALRS